MYGGGSDRWSIKCVPLQQFVEDFNLTFLQANMVSSWGQAAVTYITLLLAFVWFLTAFTHLGLFIICQRSLNLIPYKLLPELIAYLYNTLPSCLLSCSTVSRYVLFMYFYKSKHKLLLVTTPWFLWAAFWNLGADKPLAQVQERN